MLELLVNHLNLSKMKREVLNQYTWIIKVLDSSENQKQIETSERLFELFINNNKKDISAKNIIILTTNFERIKKGKLINFKTSKKSFLSKISQFFLF